MYSKVLLEKLIVAQLVITFPVFYVYNPKLNPVLQVGTTRINQTANLAIMYPARLVKSKCYLLGIIVHPDSSEESKASSYDTLILTSRLV
jgi:hypothetical protein